MKLFQKSRKAAKLQDKDKTAKDAEMRRAMYTVGKTVGNRNPMSRGQGYNGDSKVAMLQMMRDDD